MSPLSRVGHVIGGLQVQLRSGHNYPGPPSSSARMAMTVRVIGTAVVAVVWWL